jgi:WD40 repeat protein
MRLAVTALLLALAACDQKPAAPPTPEVTPIPRPVFDGGDPTQVSHVRAAPKGGEVKELPGGELLLLGHTEAIMAVAFDPTGTRAVTGGFDRSVRLWDLEHRKLVWAVGPGDEAITVLSFDPTGAVVAAGDRAFQVRLLNAQDGALLRRRAHPDAVSSVSFSPDGKWLAIGGAIGNAEVYPAGDDGPSKCEVRGRTVEFTDHGKNVVSATPSGNLIVTAFPSCKKVKETSTAPHLPFAAASASASLVGTRNGAEPFVLLWDALKGRMLGKLDHQTGGVSSLQLSPDGKRALIASDDLHVRLYDVDKAEVLKTIDTHALPFAAYSPDGSKALIGDGLIGRVVGLAP